MVPAAILLAAGVIIFTTLPPRTVTMATGPAGGAYQELGLRYRDILARSGVRLRLVNTTGGLDNLARLRDRRSGVQAGFIQGGTTTKEESPNVESLGTMFFEPLWLFYRKGIGDGMERFRGRRISIGPEGSGGRALAIEIMKRTKVDAVVGELLPFSPQEAADKLIAGEIDMAFVVSGWDSPVVRQLMAADGIDVANVPRPDAFIALYPFLSKVVLPSGVADLAANRPPSDVILLAAKASLAVRDDLHPAIQYLLLNAAVEIHSPPGIFQKAGQFPAAEAVDLPLSEEAQRFYKSGRPVLQAYLPFWMAALVERFLVVFLPALVLLYPAFRLVPQGYDWLMQSRIRRLYDEMKSIERELAAGQEPPAALKAKLDGLTQKASELQLPVKYASMQYTLRMHLDLVRDRISARAAGK
ncbi:MAG TPA: TAXI family TRAP transporter solute-binding subunit [Pseudolabrys sp.]|nr:TAXI family TRAP transporter solute-binding subunit [Pseudolabrys sp.]